MSKCLPIRPPSQGSPPVKTANVVFPTTTEGGDIIYVAGRGTIDTLSRSCPQCFIGSTAQYLEAIAFNDTASLLRRKAEKQRQALRDLHDVWELYALPPTLLPDICLALGALDDALHGDALTDSDNSALRKFLEFQGIHLPEHPGQEIIPSTEGIGNREKRRFPEDTDLARYGEDLDRIRKAVTVIVVLLIVQRARPSAR